MIEAWKSPPQTTTRKLMRLLGVPFNLAGDAVMKIPGVAWSVKKTVGGIVKVANDVAQWSVRPEAVFGEFANRTGTSVTGYSDIAAMDLQKIDEAIGYLAAKYKLIAAAEGVGTGAAGPLGVPPDIVLLVTMNLRAAGEYATYCGFDVTLEDERLFALHILALASSPDDTSRAVELAELKRVAQAAARKKTWKEIEKGVVVQIVQQIAQALGMRLTRAKLAQMVPVAGAVVGGGFNAQYTATVCDAAFHLYRERFLQRKYGDDLVEQ